MKIKEAMTKQVRVINPNASVQEAGCMMRDGDFGCIPVCDGDRIVGMITDRDIAVKAVAAGDDVKTCKVSQIMSPHIVYIFEDQDVAEAARLMEVKAIRRLVVLDRKKKLVGLLSLGDISSRGHDQYLSGEVLERISEQPPQHVSH